MRLTRVALLLAVGLWATACGGATPYPTETPFRTAIPTWTLPFRLETPTAGVSRPLSDITPTPPAATAEATQPAATQAAPTEPPPTLAPPTPTPFGPPRLIIPELELDQVVRRVGIVGDEWDLENLGDEVGWLATTGERPGDTLAMVLVGHVTTAPGQAGPFSSLEDLRVGDQFVYRWGGLDYVYEVREQAVAKTGDVQQLYVPDGRQMLLVTCSNWSYFSLAYTRRLIVTAEWIGSIVNP